MPEVTQRRNLMFSVIVDSNPVYLSIQNICLRPAMSITVVPEWSVVCVKWQPVVMILHESNHNTSKKK